MTQHDLTHPFDDPQDAYRVGYGRQTAPLDLDDPPDDFEPVLEIRIPIETTLVTANGVPHLDVAPREAETDWEAFPDQDSGWADFNGGVDETLERELDAVFPVTGPHVAPSSRMLVTITDPFYERLLPQVEDHQARRFLEGYLDARAHTHELGFDTPGAHGHTLLDPATATHESLGNVNTMGRALIDGDIDEVARLHRSDLFAEVAALVAEHQVANMIQNTDGLPAAYHDAARQLDTSLHDARTTDNPPARTPITTTPQDIVAFLHDPDTPGPALPLDRIQTLLGAGRYTIRPDEYLAHLLRDLAADDGPTAADLPHHCSLWSVMDADFDERREDSRDARSPVIEDAFTRTLHSTFEAVSIERGTLVRRWWARNPPRPFPISVLKHHVFVRHILSAYHDRFGCTPLQGTRQPVTDGEQVLADFMFDDEGIDPFARAIRADTTPDQLDELFVTGRTDETQVDAFARAVGDALTDLGFGSVDDFNRWVNS